MKQLVFTTVLTEFIAQSQNIAFSFTPPPSPQIKWKLIGNDMKRLCFSTSFLSGKTLEKQIACPGCWLLKFPPSSDL